MPLSNDPALLSGSDRWQQLRSHVGCLTDWGERILKQGLDAHAQTIVVEPQYVCKDHRNVHSNFYSKKFIERSPTCTRLHFFTKPGIRKSDLLLATEEMSEYYIGFSVIRPVRDRCIGRTVIDPWKVGRNISDGYYLLRTKFEPRVYGQQLTVAGYPYMSQDGEATVCAHTALWGLCRYLSERYNAYEELHPYDLISMTGDANGRRVPYRGMRYSDYSTILTQFGCHPEVIRTKTNISDPTLAEPEFRTTCIYVESGFPVLASYNGHVVSVVGHTMDLSRNPTPDASGFIDSTKFLKQFIVVDDNFFPYQLLGPAGDPQNYTTLSPKKYDINSICVVVCPLPEKVYLPADKAREQFIVALNRFMTDGAVAAAIRDSKSEPLVLRTFVTTNSAFKRRRLQKSVSGGNHLVDSIALKVATFHLPHFIWVMEVSPLSLYRSGQCTAEIVIDATANQREGGLIYARYGHNLLLPQSNVGVKEPGGSPIFQQYTHNLGEL